MKVVTIISPAYRKVGKTCVARIKKYLGKTPEVISTTNALGFEAKLSLEKSCKGPHIFVDCDLWFLQKWTPEYPGAFSAVHDSAVFNPHAFCHTDCEKNGLMADRYVNTGLFMCDLSDPKMRKVFQDARKSWRAHQKKPRCEDKTDQYHINRALLDNNIGIQLLPTMFNFYLNSVKWGQFPYIPRQIIGLHGAGIPAKQKYDELKAQAKVFGGHHLPMCQDAVNFTHNRTFLFP